MSLSKRTTAISVLAAAVLAGPVLSGAMAPAVAATTPSVQLTVCNERVDTRNFDVSGLNQNGQYVKYSRYALSKSCTPIEGWWWKTGQSLKITHYGSKAPTTVNTTCRIGSSFADGSTVRCRIW